MPASAPPRPPTSAGRLAGRAPDAAATDAVLVRLAACGDEAAFEALFTRHRTAVHAQAVRMLRDHGRAEDVVQDVFVSAMRALQEGREPTHPAAWLREVTRRACIDQWRATTRRAEVSLDAPGELRAGDARRLADDDSLARATEDRESVATLRSAFRDLPALQHAVLVQRELEGRAPDEIASRLGLSRTVVEGQLARGRRTLARAYRELQSGERCAAVRVLCDASVERALGVRERARVTGHLSGCDACRRHARACGVEARLLHPTTLAAKATLLLPLPLLRRWPVESLLTSEVAGGALGAKVLVGAAVLAAGSGTVYAGRDAPVRHTLPPAAVAAPHGTVSTTPTPETGLLLTLSGQLVARTGAAPGAGPAGGGASPWSLPGLFAAGAGPGTSSVGLPPAAGGASAGPGAAVPSVAGATTPPAGTPSGERPVPATGAAPAERPTPADAPRTEPGRGGDPSRGDAPASGAPRDDGERVGPVGGADPAPVATAPSPVDGGERLAPPADGIAPAEPASEPLVPEAPVAVPLAAPADGAPAAPDGGAPAPDAGLLAPAAASSATAAGTATGEGLATGGVTDAS